MEIKKILKVYLLDKPSIDYYKNNISIIKALLYSFLLVFLLSFIFLKTPFLGLVSNPSYFKYGTFGILAAYLIYYGIYILVNGSIFHLILKFFNGKGKYLETIKFSSLTFIPFIFSYNFYAPGDFISVIFGLILMVWFFILSYKIFSQLHSLSKIKTFFSLIILFLLFRIIRLL